MQNLLVTIIAGLSITLFDPETYTALSEIPQPTIRDVVDAELAGGGPVYRRKNAYIRGLCTSMLNWLDKNYAITPAKSIKGPEPVNRMLTAIILVHYNSLQLYIFMRQGRLGSNVGIPLTSQMIQNKIEAALPRGSSYPKFVEAFVKVMNERYRYGEFNHMLTDFGEATLHRLNSPHVPFDLSTSAIIDMGRNCGDRLCEEDTETCE